MTLTKEELLRLQNGSDIRGVAIKDKEGEADITLTGEAVNRIAGAFVQWLQQRCGRETVRIGVGHDSRLSAADLLAQVLAGAVAAGADAVNCRLASTPAMFMGTVYEQTQFDGSIMITASHLPYNRNGLKFFVREGGLEKAEITALLELAAGREVAPATAAEVKQLDLLSLYSSQLRTKIRQEAGGEKPLGGLRIVVDAGNGAGGFFATAVLAELGADITGSQFLEPDGRFPNHVPDPENKAAMASLGAAVRENQADLGIIFDPDVDRMSAVLADGTAISRDALIAMMAAIAAKDCPGGTIVTDSVTSDKLTHFLENTLGCRHRRFKRGYKNVINECKRLNAAGRVSPLAIETSGHGAFRENHYLDDGCYMAVKLIVAAVLENQAGRGLESLIADLQLPQESREYRMKIKAADFKSYGHHVLALFEQRAAARGIDIAPDSCEGVRLSFSADQAAGWALLRTSLHDPVLALNMEGSRPGDCDIIASIIKSLIGDCDGIDLCN